MAYIDYSMSVRAGQAYDAGLLPKSKIAAMLGIKSSWIADNVKYEEWHHTSCKYNVTYFYDTIAVVRAWCASNKITPKMKKWLQTYNKINFKERQDWRKRCEKTNLAYACCWPALAYKYSKYPKKGA